MCSHLLYDPLLQQALLLGSHDKVVGFIFVVDDILQINTWSKKMKRAWLVGGWGRDCDIFPMCSNKLQLVKCKGVVCAGQRESSAE